MAGDASRENGKKGGRPKGTLNKPRFLDFYTEKELEQFVAETKEKAKTDSRIHAWIADQIFHKAPQAVDVTTNGKELPQPILAPIVNKDGTL